MIVVQIKNIKNFMNNLLLSDMFDHFLLQETTIVNGASYVIDGHVNKDLYNTEELESLGVLDSSFFPYSQIRPKCLSIVKGKHTPGYFKFVFLLSPTNLEKTLSSIETTYTPLDVSGMFLNIKFQNGILTLTTGISYKTFNIDKSLDNEWDRLVRIFLSKNNIDFDIL
ncbi:DUF5721 family protein [Lachnobacterium bovis]|jgi:hypothetical protein|uniref:Uncharacterized protein n=1 Tax=Lachnobacterium bovis TaxID=140626 RepID=A0A1H9S444_9FIRM|nr:DUF5721 family protein [Lachnobacterium bovis]SER79133.1 hypothetical protein SAMN02910429_01107 [Lachnobacterium bovis]